MPTLQSLLRCPRCLNGFQLPSSEDSQTVKCSNDACLYATVGFPVVGGQPILIDFERSIFCLDQFTTRNGASVVRRDKNRFSIRAAVTRVLLGENKVAARFGASIIYDMKKWADRPRLLVVGGGTIGSGIRNLYTESDIEITGVDVYVSPHTRVVADGHHLPFVDESFDGVWVQAVLEHVLNPNEVVAEIHRVLKPNGIVYADTPFMQQVHERAYDFTRFTLSGHRWLFRHFSLCSAGAVSGAGSATIWSIRYLVRSITGSDKVSTAVSLMFFWLRFLDSAGRSGANADAACGVYFYGRKAERPIEAKSMLQFYEQQNAPPARPVLAQLSASTS
jgi:SAM-dependent methyltransferase